MVTLVATKGKGSMDLYAQKLAENLNVPQLHTDIYQKVAERFNIPVLCPTALKAAWQDWCFVRTLNKLDGIVHLPNHHLGRYGLFLKTPYIITVHDLIRYFDLKGYGTFIHRPNLRDRFYLSLDYKGVKKAAKIIAVSQATMRDLVQHLGIPEERISIVYEGIDHHLFKPVERRLVDYPYVLYVGSEHPRKNFARLVRAFFKLKSKRRFKDLKLVKVGKAGGTEAQFRRHTLQMINELNIPHDVIFTDYVAEEDLPAYYSGAECFVLPSSYEGFGLPPLEAMACGCPVIVSDRTSLPEVTEEAAIKVNPHDTDDLASALEMILTCEHVKRGLVSKGLEHARRFSWEKAAGETLKVYESVERSLSTEYIPVEVTERRAAVMQQAEATMKSSEIASSHGGLLPKAKEPGPQYGSVNLRITLINK